MNPYNKLNVPEDADPDDIKKAYHRAAGETHPDKGGDPEDFKEVALAYDILSDEMRRRRYDQEQEIPKQKNIDNEGGSLMMRVFNDVLSQKGEDCNVIKETLIALKHQQASTPLQLQKIKRMKESCEKVMNSITRDDESPFPDLIRESLKLSITDLKISREKVLEQHKVINKALEIIKYYSFRHTTTDLLGFGAALPDSFQSIFGDVQ